MTIEVDWERDRRRFVAGDAEQRKQGRTGYPAGDAVPSGFTHEGPLAAEFVSLADVLFSTPRDAGLQGLLHRIVAAAIRMVPGADLVSIVFREHDGAWRTVAHSELGAVRVDEIQRDLREGPGVTATEAEGVAVAVEPHLVSTRQWTRFGPRAAELGVHAVMSTGMFPGGSPPRFGALNYYSWTEGGLDDADRDHALLLATHAATAVAGVQARTAAELQVAQLEQALESRDVIGQAKGILMERRGLDADEAFSVLRRTSQDLNVKLREVAETLVTRRREL